MPLQASGTITLNQVRAEHGGPPTNIKATNYYRDPSNNTTIPPYVQNSNKSPPTYTVVTGYHPGRPPTCGRTCYTVCPQHCPHNGYSPTGVSLHYNCAPGQKPSHSQYGGVFYCDPAMGRPGAPGGTYSYTTLNPGVVTPANQRVPLSGTIKWSNWYGSYRG